MLKSGERQVASTIDGIRQDHIERYRWADKTLLTNIRVIDLGCGIGYGSALMAKSGRRVIGVDRDVETIDYARSHYGEAEYAVGDFDLGRIETQYDAAVAFEVIEHLEDPRSTLKSIRAGVLLASVPNETYFPYAPNIAFHHRHYTQDEFAALLDECGWQVQEIKHQYGPESPVTDNPGRTLIAKAIRKPDWDYAPIAADTGADEGLRGKHIAIVALGESANSFTDVCKRMGGASAYCDEVWGINAMGDTVRCDRVFHMDDVRVQEARAEAAPLSNIANMIRWLKHHPGPIYTSHIEPGYPGLVEYPLADVIKEVKQPYFNSTVAYAMAFAIYHRVGRVSIFGCDYSYAHSHHAERGRACLEYWMGVAAARGIRLTLPESTTLMDAIDGPDARFYGYDGYTVEASARDGVTLTPKPLPTVEEIEERYNHDQPTNSLVRQGVTEQR